MNAIAEKMRQIAARLKSAGDMMRRTAGARVRDAMNAAQRTRKWRGERHDTSKTAVAPAANGEWSDAAIAGRALMDDTSVRLEKASGRARHPLLKAMRIALIALAAFLALPYPLMLIFRVADPPFSSLMLRHALLGRDIRHDWVDFQNISPNLATAAVIAEDAAFCRHWGVDWDAVGDALEDLEDGDRPRGASTIPMQTAKNLFLWPEQDYVRKALEVPLATFMTLVWPKQRVLEVYLNIAEWGPGIYGAEAASRYHFGKSAASLSQSEAALLVAALPSPQKRNAGKPNGRTQSLAVRVQTRVAREAADASCIFGR